MEARGSDDANKRGESSTIGAALTHEAGSARSVR